MFKVIALAATLAAASIVPAAAQDWGGRQVAPPAGQDWGGPGPRGYGAPRGDYGRPRDAWLSPRQIARALRYQGFFAPQFLNQRGDVTIYRAASRGRDFILVVDSGSGDVLRARPAGPSWNQGYGWHGGWGNDWHRW